jgi:hypothetical protein
MGIKLKKRIVYRTGTWDKIMNNWILIFCYCSYSGSKSTRKSSYIVKIDFPWCTSIYCTVHTALEFGNERKSIKWKVSLTIQKFEKISGERSEK